jgi:hypothetical protein
MKNKRYEIGNIIVLAQETFTGARAEIWEKGTFGRDLITGDPITKRAIAFAGREGISARRAVYEAVQSYRLEVHS